MFKYFSENQSQVWSEVDPFTIERYQQFSKYICENMDVLDIGCNTGRGGIALKNTFRSIKIYGIEIIEQRISQIPSCIYEKVFHESIVNWTSCDLKFDRIIAGEVIEHIPAEDFLLMLMKCKQHLKEDGLIIFTTPNPESFLIRLGRDNVFKDPSHVNIMTVKKFKEIVESAGLEIVKIEGSGKAVRYIGSKIPFLDLYGSYLAVLKN